jgi:hypothetical protein
VQWHRAIGHTPSNRTSFQCVRGKPITCRLRFLQIHRAAAYHAEAVGNLIFSGGYRGQPKGSGHETRSDLTCSYRDALQHVRICAKRSAKRAGFHDRRSRGKFCHPWHVADHGEFDEAEPERKRNVHLRR